MKLVFFVLPILFTILSFNVASVESADLIDELKSLDIFRIRDGSLACPLPVVGQTCPESNAVYYFRCCGDVASNCCVRIQDWLIAIIALFIILSIIGLFVQFIKCIFC